MFNFPLFPKLNKYFLDEKQTLHTSSTEEEPRADTIRANCAESAVSTLVDFISQTYQFAYYTMNKENMELLFKKFICFG